MGQRQRIALARAVFGAPRLVILDEPAAYLDAEGEAAVLRLVAALAARGTAVVLASHREALLRAAPRHLVLRDGVLAPAGPGQRLLADGRRRPAPEPALRLAAATEAA
jgi:ABC-type protease/lipase transport system fused ATPase/permease subunit